MLVLDSLCRHITERVKAKVNISDLVIRGRIIKLLQTFIVVINQPFKIAFWQLYHQWMATTKYNLRPSSRMKQILCWQCVNDSLQHGIQFLQKLWRKAPQLLTLKIKWTGVRISRSVKQTMKVILMIMVIIAVSVTMNDTNMLVDC
jgi:hypothetical protein